jgi:hypothetical protein
MTNGTGHLWDLVRMCQPAGLGARSSADLREAFSRLPPCIEESLEGLSRADQDAVLTEASGLAMNFAKSAAFDSAKAASVLMPRTFHAAVQIEVSADSITREDVTRAGMHLAIGSYILRRALSITNDPATAELTEAIASDHGVDPRVATKFYDFAALEGLVPPE